MEHKPTPTPLGLMRALLNLIWGITPADDPPPRVLLERG